MNVILIPLIDVVQYALWIYMWIVVIQAVASWLIAFNILNTYSRPVSMILDFLYRVTEPVLRPIRQFVPNLGGIDISPIVLWLIIIFLREVLSGIEARLLSGGY